MCNFSLQSPRSARSPRRSPDSNRERERRRSGERERERERDRERDRDRERKAQRTPVEDPDERYVEINCLNCSRFRLEEVIKAVFLFFK